MRRVIWNNRGFRVRRRGFYWLLLEDLIIGLLELIIDKLGYEGKVLFINFGED